MDDSPIQSAVCVIGHPIAGNPAQFCLSRALAALEVDWQCLSFDIPPDSLMAALDGVDVLGFAAALVAFPHPPSIADWLARRANEPADQWVDGLSRAPAGRWTGHNFAGEALARLLQNHSRAIERPLDTCVFLGDQVDFDSLTIPYREQLPASRLILRGSNDGFTAPEGPLVLLQPPDRTVRASSAVPVSAIDDAVADLLESPDPDSLTLWLSDPMRPWTPSSVATADAIEPSENVISPLDLEVERLLAVIRCWTGREASRPLLGEAIEEYLGI